MFSPVAEAVVAGSVVLARNASLKQPNNKTNLLDQVRARAPFFAFLYFTTGTILTYLYEWKKNLGRKQFYSI